ncbi:MAG: ATP-dependent Clp protease proteolytic subunit [Deltaproteobacteria bacterium]|nr:ATP-dependent Clp protease proteolytic subunit [Deltaproteobacteria bacterium]
MSLLNEYIRKRLSGNELEAELLRLITEYNKLRDTYLFVFSAAIGKPIPAISLEQADFYIFHDLLSGKNRKSVDIYIETPGGSGETAEEIVRFLHKNFDTVSFIVSGEAKSAGTLIVLSGDEILMTETGSLGPIDAQVKIGRSVVSAYDYVEWVNQKRQEAEDQGTLNPFDATMVAQITPGELSGVYHALKYAEELVVEWLVNYKFRKWHETETRKEPVTLEAKKKRAGEIAAELTNHAKWRLHGRSIKIDDLENIGLKIKRVEDDIKLRELVHRIQIVCRLLFDTTTTFKIFATEDTKIFRQAAPANVPIKMPLSPEKADVVQIDHKCPQCGIAHKIYAKFNPNPQIDQDLQKQGFRPFPKNGKIQCNCGFEMDLTGLKNQIESNLGKSMIL